MVVRIFLTEISVITITIIIIITTVFEFILHTESDTYIIFTDVFIVEKIAAKNFEI